VTVIDIDLFHIINKLEEDGLIYKNTLHSTKYSTYMSSTPFMVFECHMHNSVNYPIFRRMLGYISMIRTIFLLHTKV
jgi:hypothetical protein